MCILYIMKFLWQENCCRFSCYHEGFISFAYCHTLELWMFLNKFSICYRTAKMSCHKSLMVYGIYTYTYIELCKICQIYPSTWMTSIRKERGVLDFNTHHRERQMVEHHVHHVNATIWSSLKCLNVYQKILKNIVHAVWKTQIVAMH